MQSPRQSQTLKKAMFACVFLISFATVCAFPTLDDDRIPEREYMVPSPHQLASWLAYQLRKNNYVQQASDSPLLRFRLTEQGKRNSELTNSMMGIPRNMIDNGKK